MHASDMASMTSIDTDSSKSEGETEDPAGKRKRRGNN